MPTSQLQTARHFEWDSSWSLGFLVLCAVMIGAWSLWQIVREARIARTRWSVLFIGLRAVVVGVLLWMILGPTSVLVRTETNPRTLAVYLDTSSSMQIHDQPDPIADGRWGAASKESAQPLVAADRAVLFAEAMRQEAANLTKLVEQQSPRDERQQSTDKWGTLCRKCASSLDAINGGSLPSEQRELLSELKGTLQTELQPLLKSTDWVTGTDPGDRDERLHRLGELGTQFAVRCRILAEGVAHTSIQPQQQGRANGDEKTRLDRVVPALREALSAWTAESQGKFRIRLSGFSDKVSNLPMQNWDPSIRSGENSTTASKTVRRTDLTELLKQIRDDSGKEEVAAAVVLTDGRQSVGAPEDPRNIAGQLRVPLYLVPIGRGEMKRDVILQHLQAPLSVLEKDKILIEGMATAYRCAGEGCDVQLLEGDKIVESRRVTFTSEQEDQRFRFEIPTEKTGRREFKLRIPELKNENSAENNVAAVGVNVADAVLKILVADGRARWEHQYIINLLKRQKQVQFDQLKFLPQPSGTGKRYRTNQFPETVEEWAEYRVVILGDVSPRQFSQKSQESLREYITQRGGCLIVIAGQYSMPHAYRGEPLEEILPVELASGFQASRAGYRVEMTAEGKTLDVMRLADDLASTEEIWREMGGSLPIYFLSNYNKPKPTSQVLLNAYSVDKTNRTESVPAFLSWQNLGAGRVAYLSSPSTYQLRMRNGDKYHHRFWGQLVRWIVSNSASPGSRCVKLLADKSHYRTGDAAQIQMDLSDMDGRPVSKGNPTVDVLRSGKVISNIPLSADPKVPGRYLGRFTAEEESRYALQARGPDVEKLLAGEKIATPIQIAIEFEPDIDRELLDPRADRPLLEHLAEQTGGLVLEPTCLTALTQVLSLEPRILESSQRTPLWDRWWCFWVILGCLTTEWIVRKRVGLA
ncbi:MAG: hypothetical protein U0903_03995 [Planctomycetales bacterium]